MAHKADFPRPIRMMPDWITSESPTNQELACPVVKNALFYKGVVQCTQILQTATCWRNCRDERRGLETGGALDCGLERS